MSKCKKSKFRKMSEEERLQLLTNIILEIKDEKKAKELAKMILNLLDDIHNLKL